MKKFSVVTSSTLALVLMFGFAIKPAHAINAYDFFCMQRDATNTSNMVTLLPIPAGGANGLIVLNGGTSTCSMATFGSRLSWNSSTGNVEIDLTNQPESNTTNLVSDLAARLIASNNLSDLGSASTARTNLGLGSASTQASTAFATSAQGALASTALQNVTGLLTAGTNTTLTGSGTSASPYVINASGSSARSFSTPTFASTATSTQLSVSRDAAVTYDYDAATTISLLAGQTVTVTLQYADNAALTTNLVTVSSQTTGNSGVLGLSQTNTLKVSGEIPAGKYRKVTFSTTGTGTVTPTTLKAGQEVLE